MRKDPEHAQIFYRDQGVRHAADDYINSSLCAPPRPCFSACQGLAGFHRRLREHRQTKRRREFERQRQVEVTVRRNDIGNADDGRHGTEASASLITQSQTSRCRRRCSRRDSHKASGTGCAPDDDQAAAVTATGRGAGEAGIRRSHLRDVLTDWPVNAPFSPRRSQRNRERRALSGIVGIDGIVICRAAPTQAPSDNAGYRVSTVASAGSRSSPA